MSRKNAGGRNPRNLCEGALISRGLRLVQQIDSVDVMRRGRATVHVDYGRDVLTILIGSAHEGKLGRILPFDPLLSGKEIAEMLLERMEDYGV